MPEISTVAVITAKPGSADQVQQALTTLAGATHAEPGCLHYSLHRGLADPNVFVTIEKWRAQEDLDAHGKSAHIAAAFAAMGEHVAGRPTIIAGEMLPAGDPAKGTF